MVVQENLGQRAELAVHREQQDKNEPRGRAEGTEERVGGNYFSHNNEANFSLLLMCECPFHIISSASNMHLTISFLNKDPPCPSWLI